MNIDDFINSLSGHTGTATAYTLNDFIVIFLLDLILLLIITWVYKKTHTGISYSKLLTRTIIMTGLVTAGIVVAVGSNIARAFTLVGALTIIRFRTAIKEPMDVSYLFFAITVGMAVGTRTYTLAVYMTLFISLIMIILKYVDFGAKRDSEEILRIVMPSSKDHTTLFGDVFRKYLDMHYILSVDGSRGGFNEITLAVRFRKKASVENFMDELRVLNDGNSIVLLPSESREDM